MVKRRPMGSALSLNSETLAFIHGGPTGAKREAELVKPLTVGHSPDRSSGAGAAGRKHRRQSRS